MDETLHYPIVVDHLMSSGRKSEPKAVLELLGEFAISVDLYTLLGAADYLLFTKDFYTVGIERKSAGDLFSSLVRDDVEPERSSRLERQLARLTEAFDFPVLAITGSIERSIDGKVIAAGRRREWWYNFYSMWQWKQSTKLWILADDIAFAKSLLVLREWLSSHDLVEVASTFSTTLGSGLQTTKAQSLFMETKNGAAT